MSSLNPTELWARIQTEIKYENYTEALEHALNFAEHFPENFHGNTLVEAAIQCALSQTDKALTIFKNALDTKGCWYTAKNLSVDYAKEFKTALESGLFDQILATWEEKRANEEKSIEHSAIVTKPKSSQPEARYPMFLGLHGWGESAEFFKQHWHNKYLEEQFICLYPQSSVLGAPGRPCWDDPDRSYEDIVALFEDRSNIQSVIFGKSIWGGFSQGGRLALEYVLRGNADIRFCLSLCPTVPDVTDDHIRAAANRNVKVYIVLGGLDKINVTAVTAFARRLEQHELIHKIEIDPKCSHWFPETFPEMTRNALDFFSVE